MTSLCKCRTTIYVHIPIAEEADQLKLSSVIWNYYI